MIKIERFAVNMLQENCYVVSDETNEAVIIDCGALFDNDKQRIREYVDANKLALKHHICTHGHFDHVMGSAFVYEAFGLQPELTAADQELYRNSEAQIVQFVGVNAKLEMPQVGDVIDETSKITFGSHTFTVIPSPGHTPGGVAFYCAEEQVLFSGDSLFYGSIGRTDFPSGDERMLIEMLKTNILTLPESVKVYPGHGQSTTVGFEKENNPYLTTF